MINVRALVVLSASVVLTASTAHAQSLGSNQVYIGQTGDTNIITIDQEGNSNLVGEQADALRLNQFGARNTITVDQFGFSNSLGARIDAFDPRFVVYGPNQRGDRNELTVLQRNLNAASGNSIGATGQQSDAGGTTLANRIAIDQRSAAGSLGHTVDQVVQIDDGAASFNDVRIVQTDVSGFGGNIIGRIWQLGAGNLADLGQENGRNEIRTITQQGEGNTVTIRQSGAGNFVDIVEQNNAVTGGAGNSAVLTFFSDENGISGASGVSDFAAGFATNRKPGQAQLFQLGSGNTLSFSVSGGPQNLYGFTQEGDGNDIAAVTVGTGNELALAQFGDGNLFASGQDGDDNLGAILSVGNYNSVDLTQNGDRNQARAFIFGNDVNGAGRSFDAPLLAASDLIGADRLTPGELRQIGSNNSLNLDVFGDDHLFAVLSQGSGNQVAGLIQGAGNQALVIQTGDGNIANFSQSGSGNSVLILQ